MEMLHNIIRIIEEYWQIFLLEGLKFTLILSAIAVFFGVILGSFIAFGRMSNIKPFKSFNKKKKKKGFIFKLANFNPVSWICSVYTEIIRGTPLLLQLYLFVFGLPKIIPIKADYFFWVSLALACNSAAYVSELLRSGIQAVDKGQTEAARSLGMNKAQTMLKVIMPQAIKNILPAIGNEFIAIVKETSMASTFFIGELMTSYLKVNGVEYLALEILIVVGAIYLALTTILSKIVLAYERRLNSK